MQTVEEETTSAPSRLSPSRLPGWLRWLLIAVVAIVVLLALALVVFRLVNPGVLPGTSVAGIDVGDLSRPELETVVTELEDERASATLTAELAGEQVAADAAALGYSLDVDATVEEVWRHGHQDNPLLALGDHVRSLYDETTVEPVSSLDSEALDAWVAQTADAFDRDPVEGEVRFDGAEVVSSPPEIGYAVERPELAQQVRAAVLEPGDDEIAVPHEVREPVSTDADVQAMVERAELAVSAPVELFRNDGVLELSPEELGAFLTIAEDFSADAEEVFRLTADPEDLLEQLSDDQIAAFESEPSSATFQLTSDGMQIEPATIGFEFDAQIATDQIVWASGVEAGSDDTRRTDLDGVITEPDRTTEEAEALQIVEPVASFTTEHQCCEGRVQNIQRFADIVRGTVVEPGDTISLNEVVGPRTRAKGFTGGGAILRGEYIEDVGGGVSQFATTFFNAAYFGGYEILEHKPHSYYISRYPAGRESTIDYPGVDVVVRNNSPYGMYVDTSYTSTSITVTIWGKEWADVESTTGDRFRFRDPETQVEINRDLPAGAERVTQSGKQGFDIVVTRTVTELESGESRTREFYTRYLPEPRIIERNPA